MKKFLLLLLTLALIVACFAACDITDPDHTTESTSGTNGPGTADAGFAVPNDEKTAVYTVSQTNGDGLKMEVTVHGYQSESLNKSFYVKNNEYFTVDIKLTNESASDLYQSLPTYCRHNTTPPAHNHEIGFDLSHGETKLSSSSFGFICPDTLDLWTLEAGKSYEWQLKLAAGEARDDGERDLPADGPGVVSAGIKLYEKDIFTNNACVFDGSLFFDYSKIEDQYGNACSVSVPLSIEVVYIASQPNQ